MDELGHPLYGALVVASPSRSAEAGASVVRTDADGSFTLPVLPPGRYVLLAVGHEPELATSEPVVVEGGFLPVPLRLVVSRAAVLL